MFRLILAAPSFVLKSRLDIVATCGYNWSMKTVSIREAKNKLTELAREIETGMTVVVTRHGRPVFDLVPHRPRLGLNLETGSAFLRERGFASPVCIIEADFDEALPEDFLLIAENAAG